MGSFPHTEPQRSLDRIFGGFPELPACSQGFSALDLYGRFAGDQQFTCLLKGRTKDAHHLAIRGVPASDPDDARRGSTAPDKIDEVAILCQDEGIRDSCSIEYTGVGRFDRSRSLT